MSQEFQRSNPTSSAAGDFRRGCVWGLVAVLTVTAAGAALLALAVLVLPRLV